MVFGDDAMKARVYRCAMTLPINNPRFVEKLWTRGADGYTLDLEDSVPLPEKEKARSLVHETIPKATKGGASAFVRINEQFIEADLQAAIWPGIERITLPKAEHAKDVKYVSDIITELEKERGIPVSSIEVSPSIESTLGAANIYEITTSSPRIKAMGGGTGYDMALNLGIEMFAGFNQYAYPDAYCALTEMAAGLEATGGIFVSNPSGRVDQGEQAILQAAALHATQIHRAGSLHPAMIQPLVSGLTPTADEVKWAQKVIREYEKLVHAGESVTVIDGKVVDKYEYAFAKRLLEWADACAAKDRFKERALARAQAEEK